MARAGERATGKRSAADPATLRLVPRTVRSSSRRRRLEAAGLLAGIGGIELGLTRAGHETLLLCELDSSAHAVLRERFPEIPLRADVREVRSLPRDVELPVAGFRARI